MPAKGSKEVYPPKGGWVCDVCKKEHTKPHFSYPGQTDETKKPAQVGRVKFNRESKTCDKEAGDTPHHEVEGKTGPAKDELGFPRGLYCPHCGSLQDTITITKATTSKKKKRLLGVF